MNGSSQIGSDSVPPVPGHLVPIPMIVATLILSIIGFIGNLMIVLATLVTQNLGSRCNVLISILALCDAIICAYLIHLRILMFIRFYNVTNWKCFWTSIYGLFALNCQSAIGLVIGIDRLLAVLLPIRYARIPKSIYVALISVTLIFAFVITYIGYEDSSDAIKVAVCLPPTAYNEKSRKIWIVCSIIIAILVLLVYGAAQIKCKLLSARNTHEQSLQRLKKLLNSLTLVMLMYSSTWFITVLALLATQTVPMSPSLIGIINQQLAWLVIINASTNFFIYYWRAPEYRKAFLDIVGCRCQRTRMFSISVNTQRHSQQLSMSNTAKKADREAGPDAAAPGKSVVKSIASPLSSNKLQPVDPRAKSCVKSVANSTMLVREAIPTKSTLAGPDGTQNACVMTTVEDEEDKKKDKVLAEKKRKAESAMPKLKPILPEALPRAKKGAISSISEASVAKKLANPKGNLVTISSEPGKGNSAKNARKKRLNVQKDRGKEEVGEGEERRRLIFRRGRR